MPDRWINMPDPARYEALDPADRRRVLALVQRWLCWETTGFLAMCLFLQWGLTRAPAFTTPWIASRIIGFTVLSTAAAPFLIWRVQARIDALSDPPS